MLLPTMAEALLDPKSTLPLAIPIGRLKRAKLKPFCQDGTGLPQVRLLTATIPISVLSVAAALFLLSEMYSPTAGWRGCAASRCALVLEHTLVNEPTEH